MDKSLLFITKWSHLNVLPKNGSWFLEEIIEMTEELALVIRIAGGGSGSALHSRLTSSGDRSSRALRWSGLGSGGDLLRFVWLYVVVLVEIGEVVAGLAVELDHDRGGRSCLLVVVVVAATGRPFLRAQRGFEQMSGMRLSSSDDLSTSSGESSRGSGSS